MEKQIVRFRRLTEAQFGGRPGPGDRYPEVLRALAVEIATAELARNERLGSVAQALGVAAGTLQRWLEASPSQSCSLRAVEVVGDEATDIGDGPPSGGLVLVTAAGHRVEGLAFAEVALLLEALT